MLSVQHERCLIRFDFLSLKYSLFGTVRKKSYHVDREDEACWNNLFNSEAKLLKNNKK